MEASRFTDLKPCRDLIDPSFGGYKLSLDALPVYSRNLDSGIVFHLVIIIIIIIRNLYSAIMPLGGYRGAGGTGR